MTLARRAFINFDINSGENLTILDLTGIYDATLNPGGLGSPNIDSSAINYYRYIFSSYLTELAATTSTTVVAGTEYLVGGSGSFSYDGKTYTSGDTIISMLSGTPSLSSCTLTQTGRFSSASSFLPIDVESGDLTPSLSVGISDLIYPDSSYYLQLDAFTTKYITGQTVPAGTYVCGGNAGQTITLNSITYRVNEQFTIGSSYTLTGTGFAALYYDSISTQQALTYYASQTKIALELKVAQLCGCSDQTKEALITVSNNLCAIEDYFDLNIGVDFSGVQTLLDEIASIGAQENV